ncbi:cysteine protease family C01A [Thraustotheca clavata]|uniref:Cysteine protease family C01A n=1 Tax=Thraustotheca clavata TaxID=74557 RepID=A0A1V9ZYS2_9STRA|nr:cysteine protease family C01A [Thraustotheca clavata]
MTNMHIYLKMHTPFGTLVECTDANGCLWMGKDGVLVGERRILQEAMLRFHRTSDYATSKRNLKTHINYIQDVYTHANMLGHQLTMKLGLNPRHLLEGTEGMGHPMDAALNNMMVMKREKNRRQLVSTGTSSTLNWCTSNNPKGKSVCADVKSQQLCGSCWAFAATDVIETAVALATGNSPVSLSSQQLLSCSTSKEIRTYEYCFAGSGSVPSWLQSTMKWDSQNQGCNGGMTHIALDDAANRIGNLASRIDWPYTDDTTSTNSSGPVGPTGNRRLANSTSGSSQYNTCGTSRPANLTAAHITGWEPALNASSCSSTKDPALLLKQALASGPLAVALCAQGTFKSFTSGVYTCPTISSPDMIDHALLLVGYDTGSDGDYWILKNSYGVSWGLSGFIHIKTDSIINCGLNVFPIRALGASAGPAANITVDGGGTLTFGGASMNTWIAIACVVSIVTLVLTIAGVVIARKRMTNMHVYRWKYSFGTLLECNPTCLWVGKEGKLVIMNQMLHEMLHEHGENDNNTKVILRAHMNRIQDVYKYAQAINHSLSMKLGINPRHFQAFHNELNLKTEIVHNNLVHTNKTGRSLEKAYALNWCTTNNPKGQNLCTDIKNQYSCGSCWAFAATDVIESAVAYATGNQLISLSPQQFISCSTGKGVFTYKYCFASLGPEWLTPNITWSSINKGCFGGMTYIALNHAVHSIKNLATNLDWPYYDKRQANTTSKSKSYNCDKTLPVNLTAAYIRGWEPAFNEYSCNDTINPAIILKRALATGPLAVGISADGGFQYYKGGVYTCPEITHPKLINHALLLVGFDTGPHGDYWILKNSYSTQWGIKGFIHLKVDDSINCGLNIFPTRVLGASSGPAANLTIDGGGKWTLCGLESIVAMLQSSASPSAPDEKTHSGPAIQQLVPTSNIPQLPVRVMGSNSSNNYYKSTKLLSVQESKREDDLTPSRHDSFSLVALTKATGLFKKLKQNNPKFSIKPRGVARLSHQFTMGRPDGNLAADDVLSDLNTMAVEQFSVFAATIRKNQCINYISLLCITLSIGLVISLHSPYKMAWDILMAICTVYFIVFLPLELCFELGKLYPESNSLQICIDMLFLFDILVFFSTSTLDPLLRVEIYDRGVIARAYLSSWFISDLFSSYPSSLITLSSQHIHNPLYFLKVFRIMTVFRAIRLSHAPVFHSIMVYIAHHTNPRSIRLLKLIGLYLLLHHYIACAFYMTYLAEEERGEKEVWELQFDENGTIFDKYVGSFFQAATVMGAYTLRPKTTTERIFTSLGLVTAIVANACLFGFIASLTEAINKVDDGQYDQMQAITSHLRTCKVEDDVQARIIEFYNSAWGVENAHHADKLLDGLPDKLELTLRYQLNASFLNSVPFFREIGNEGVLKMLVCMVDTVALKGDLIVKAGEQPRAFYLIDTGSVEVYDLHRDGTRVSLATLEAGGFFGEVGLINNTKTTANVAALTYCKLLVLYKDKFDEITHEYRNLKSFLNNSKHSRMANSVISKYARTNLHDAAMKVRDEIHTAHAWKKRVVPKNVTKLVQTLYMRKAARRLIQQHKKIVLNAFLNQMQNSSSGSTRTLNIRQNLLLNRSPSTTSNMFKKHVQGLSHFHAAEIAKRRTIDLQELN